MVYLFDIVIAYSTVVRLSRCVVNYARHSVASEADASHLGIGL